MPEEDWQTLADLVRPHLSAAADLLAEAAERNSELVKLCWENGTAEVVRMELADLRHHLSGRTSIGPGNPFYLSHTSSWRGPAMETARAEEFPESPPGDE